MYFKQVKIMNIQIKKLVSGTFSSAGTLVFRLYFYLQGHTHWYSAFTPGSMFRNQYWLELGANWGARIKTR